jgi:hypothetical protein
VGDVQLTWGGDSSIPNYNPTVIPVPLEQALFMRDNIFHLPPPIFSVDTITKNHHR